VELFQARVNERVEEAMVREPAKIGIVGAGAMGCLLGAFLSKETPFVWLVDVWEEHVSRIKEHGLRVTEGGKTRTLPMRATTRSEDAGICDVVIVSTKFIHTRAAMQNAAPMIGEKTLIMTIQNGIGNVEIISEFVKKSRILFGLTTLGSVLKGPGAIEATFLDGALTYLWPLEGEPNQAVTALADLFAQSGLHLVLTRDVRERIWKKLSLNAGFSVLTALARLKCGDFIKQPPSLELIRGLVFEIAAVAQKEGINLDSEATYEYVVDLAKQAPDHLTSTLIDVLNRRKTEIDCLNGAVTAKAREYGIEAPYNTAVCNLIRIIQETYDKALPFS
jgi:2-dehydropantoate 2-reductase